MNKLAERVSLGKNQQAWLRAVLTLLAILVIWSVPPAGQAQDASSPPAQPLPMGQDLRFEHLTVEDGLSEGKVWDITQDSRGFMWFATFDGLNRYDGYEFKVYKQERDNPNSPGGTQFFTVYQDETGTIWTGSLSGGGLSSFDPVTEQWRRYQHDPEDPHSLSSNNVYAILEDHAGVLWIGTEGGGLNRFEGETEDGRARFTRFGHDPDDAHALSSAFVVRLYEDRAGVLWVGTFGGLHRFDRETETFTRFRHDASDPTSLSHDSVFPIFEDQYGVLWVGTYGGGLNRFDPATGAFRRYLHDPEDPGSLSGNTIVDILEDPSGTLWIGTFDGGLSRYDRETDTFGSYQHDGLDPRSLGSTSVTCLFVDLSGIMWIGSGGAGVSKLNQRGQGFQVLRHDPTDANSLSNNDVRAILEDRFGSLWIGTSSGLNRLDREAGQVTRYLHDPADPTSLSDDHVLSITEDNAGVLWVGTDPHGLNRFDRDTGTFIRFEPDSADAHSLSGGVVSALHADREGTLWIGTWSGGLNALDLRVADGPVQFTHFRHDPKDSSSLGSGAVYAILEDREGILWVGTGGGGLCRMIQATEGFDCYRNDPEDANSLSNDAVRAIYQDKDGTLWIGTNSGLDRYDPKTGKFVHYTTADGLAHDTVHGILPDEAGHLWLGTDRGLSRFHPASRTFHNYDASDGLQGRQFNYGAYYRASTGELFFGGPNGLSFFYPDEIKANPFVPPVHITGLQLANEPIAVGGDSPLQRSIVEGDHLELSYKDRILSLEFAALDYTAPEKNRYRHMLEGFDDTWVESGSDRRIATYTNLDPGQYTFRVLGSNSDGVWNEEGASIQLTVTPPWWGAWWFQGGVLLLLLGLVAGGFVWQRVSARRREHHLEATVAERTSELGERVKELNCLYGISRLAGQQGISLEEILRGTARLVAPAFQHSEVTCARIALDDQEYKMDNYRPSPWQLEADIVVRREPAGRVQVGYLEERPEQDRGPFLREEIDLLNAVAERLGRIIERKQAEEQLRFQARMLDTIEQAVLVTDLVGHVVYWGPFAERLFDWSAEEVVGKRTREFFLVGDEQSRGVNAEIMTFLRAGRSWSGEYVARRRDGTHVPLQSTISAIPDADGELLYIVGAMTDITDRKQAEEALQKSEEKYRDLVEQVSDVIYSVDSGGVLTYLNPAIEALIGLPPEQVVGQPLDQFIHPEDLGRLQDNLQSLLSGAAPGSVEYRLLSTAGEVRWIRVTSQPMVKAGQVIGVQGVLSDLTERKRLEEQLQAAARVSERQRLARDLHDSVTQTLYSTNLFADAMHLALSTGRSDAAREHLDAVRDLVWQATLEMRMLLFELRPPLLEETGLADAIQTRLESVEARVGLPIEFKVEGERRLSPAVEEELYHLALEALNNIAKHAQATQASVCLELEEECCRLVINDDGVGFDPEAASRGGGHGLRSMQERAAQIGGHMDLESAPGQGTTVTIEVKA